MRSHHYLYIYQEGTNSLDKHRYGMSDSAISSIIWIASRNRLGMCMVIARKWESTLYTLCSSFDFHTLQIYQISSSYIARYYCRFVRGLVVRRGVDCQHPRYVFVSQNYNAVHRAHRKTILKIDWANFERRRRLPFGFAFIVQSPQLYPIIIAEWCEMFANVTRRTLNWKRHNLGFPLI